MKKDWIIFYSDGSMVDSDTSIYDVPRRDVQIIVRADSAFFDGELLELLESKGCQYMIKVKLRGLEKLLEIQK